MSPDTNGNTPVVVRRKKKINPKPNKNCFASECGCIATSHASIPGYSIENDINTQDIAPPPVFSTNYKHFMPNFNVFKSVQIPQFSESLEYSSLPTVNMQLNETSTKRRFSDPGLPNESDSSTNSAEENTIQKLRNQVHSLKGNNCRLSQEVAELRTEINILKQQSNYKYLNREYEPGKLADIIREVRDAARVREEAFFAKVKHFMEEQLQQLGLNHMHFLTEKQKNNDRMFKLEEQLKSLHILINRLEINNISMTAVNGNNSHSHSTRQVLELEKEALELRRELQDTRAKKEASDQKLIILDKKLSNLMHCNEVNSLGTSDDSKAESIESLGSSFITNTSSSKNHSRISLSGPVTDL